LTARPPTFLLPSHDPLFTERSMSAGFPDHAAVDHGQAHRTSLIRAAIVCGVWLATWSLRHNGPSVRLGLDLILAGGGLWAAAPGRRASGRLFGEHGHWTSLIIALPIGFGIAAAAELWHMLRGSGG
jgi:hypothetical protein